MTIGMFDQESISEWISKFVLSIFLIFFFFFFFFVILLYSESVILVECAVHNTHMNHVHWTHTSVWHTILCWLQRPSIQIYNNLCCVLFHLLTIPTKSVKIEPASPGSERLHIGKQFFFLLLFLRQSKHRYDTQLVVIWIK